MTKYQSTANLPWNHKVKSKVVSQTAVWQTVPRLVASSLTFESTSVVFSGWINCSQYSTKFIVIEYWNSVNELQFTNTNRQNILVEVEIDRTLVNLLYYGHGSFFLCFDYFCDCFRLILTDLYLNVARISTGL